jgi:hypothetical protein
MDIFVVFRVTNPAALGAVITSTYPSHHYVLPNGEWFIASTETPKEICDRLGVTPDGKNGTAIVVKFSGYYGRAPTEIWDWIKAKAEASA